MTREEAIEELKAIKSVYSNNLFGDAKLMKSEQDALDMEIKALEQEPCGDAISRQAVLDGIEELKRSPWATDKRGNGFEYLITEALDVVADLCVKQEPSVNPQEPKTGHWEQYGYPWDDKFKCSECGEKQPKILCGERIIGHWSDYCPNCGCRMVEPQERSDKE